MLFGLDVLRPHEKLQNVLGCTQVEPGGCDVFNWDQANDGWMATKREWDGVCKQVGELNSCHASGMIIRLSRAPGRLDDIELECA